MVFLEKKALKAPENFSYPMSGEQQSLGENFLSITITLGKI